MLTTTPTDHLYLNLLIIHLLNLSIVFLNIDMKWLIIALLLYPVGNVSVIYNQELFFSNEQSCVDYVMLNNNSIHLGAKVFLDDWLGYNHGVKVQSITCEIYQDDEKKEHEDSLNELMK